MYVYMTNTRGGIHVFVNTYVVKQFVGGLISVQRQTNVKITI